VTITVYFSERTHRIGGAWALFALGLATMPAIAQPTGRAQGLRPSTSPQRITLDEAFGLAGQRSFDLRIAFARVDEAEARVRQAWSVLLPRVTLGGGYTYSFPDSTFSLGDPAQLRQQALLFNTLADQTAAQAAQIPDPVQQRAAFERAEELRATALDLERSKIDEIEIQPTHAFDGQLQVQVPLFNGRALPLLRNAYGGVELTRLASRLARAEIVWGVARAFYQTAAATRIVAIADQQVASARAHRDLAQQRVDAGIVTPLSLQRAELDLARADQQRRSAGGALMFAKAALGSLMGAVEDFDVVEPPGVPAVEMDVPADELVARAFAAREDLRVQREALAIADRNKLEAWMRFMPTLALVGTGRATTHTGGLVSNPFTGSVALQAQLPLFDGGHTLGVIDETDAQLRIQLLSVRRAEEQIEREVRGALDDLAVKRDAVAMADRVAALARAQKENVDALFAEGAVTGLEVADASLGAFSGDVEAARARFDLETARLGLAFAMGELRPVDSVEALALEKTEASAARARVDDLPPR
jgi:outer membrane protein TolC